MLLSGRFRLCRGAIHAQAHLLAIRAASPRCATLAGGGASAAVAKGGVLRGNTCRAAARAGMLAAFVGATSMRGTRITRIHDSRHEQPKITCEHGFRLGFGGCWRRWRGFRLGERFCQQCFAQRRHFVGRNDFARNRVTLRVGHRELCRRCSHLQIDLAPPTQLHQGCPGVALEASSASTACRHASGCVATWGPARAGVQGFVATGAEGGPKPQRISPGAAGAAFAGKARSTEKQAGRRFVVRFKRSDSETSCPLDGGPFGKIS